MTARKSYLLRTDMHGTEIIVKYRATVDVNTYHKLHLVLAQFSSSM